MASPRSDACEGWDYVVIGADAAGCVAAGRLSQLLPEARVNATPASPHARSYLAAAYALRGEARAAATEFDAARNLRGPEFHSSIVHLKGLAYFGVPAVRTEFDAPFFAGLRKAGGIARADYRSSAFDENSVAARLYASDPQPGMRVP